MLTNSRSNANMARAQARYDNMEPDYGPPGAFCPEPECGMTYTHEQACELEGKCECGEWLETDE